MTNLGKKRMVNTVFKVGVKFVEQRYEKSSTKKIKLLKLSMESNTEKTIKKKKKQELNDIKN